MRLLLVNSDDTHRRELAEGLEQLGHGCDAVAALSPDQAVSGLDALVLAGATVLDDCARSRHARWVIAIVDESQVADALAAGAHDCLLAPATPAQIDLRLRVAAGRGGLGPGLGEPVSDADALDGVLPHVRGEQLRLIFDSLPMPIGMVSSTGAFVQCNREFEQMFGLAPGGATGKALDEVFANANVWQAFAQVAKLGRLRDQQLEIEAHDGTRRVVAGQAQWLPGPDGSGYTIGTFVDIGERLQAEAAMRASESSLRAVMRVSPDGIIVHRDGRIVMVNPAAVGQLGLPSAEQAVGMSLYDRILAGEFEVIRNRVEHMLRTGESAPPLDVQFQRTDGDTYIGEVVSTPVTFDGAQAIVTIVRDVSEQRRIQSQMFLADRLATVGTLAVGVAHEINNPLAWVVGNLGLLGDEFDNQVRMRELPGHDPNAVATSRGRVRELLGRAQEGTERVRRIVRDLGRFARPDEAEGQAVDLHALLDSTIEIADVQLRHRARLARDYRSCGYARGGEARLGQVFLNLLVNAGQAIEPGMPRQNYVRVVTCDLPDNRVEVAISDTGCGIPENVRKRIFEPFFTTKPVGEGTGIGLAITRDIIAAMGGEILVESEVGRGTTFRVRLYRAAEDVPSRPARAIREDSSEHAAAENKSVRVLVVDDEPLIREMVCDALAQHEVTAVATGREALEQIAARDWDLILCDMILPEVSGLGVYRELETLRPDAVDRFVFVTGGDFSKRGPKLPSGARARRLEKPFSIKALRSLVREAQRGGE